MAAAQQTAAQRRGDAREAAAVAMEGMLAEQEAAREPAVYNPLEDLGYRRDLMPDRGAVVQMLATDPQYRSASPEAKRAFIQRYDEFYSQVGKQQSANIAAEKAERARRMEESLRTALALDLEAHDIRLTEVQLDGLVNLWMMGDKEAVEKRVASITGHSEWKAQEQRLVSRLGLDRAAERRLREGMEIGRLEKEIDQDLAAQQFAQEQAEWGVGRADREKEQDARLAWQRFVQGKVLEAAQESAAQAQAEADRVQALIDSGADGSTLINISIPARVGPSRPVPGLWTRPLSRWSRPTQRSRLRWAPPDRRGRISSRRPMHFLQRSLSI